MKMLSFLLFVCVSVSCLAMAADAPKPAVVQRSQDWTLDVQYEHLQQIMLRPAGGGHSVRYWYMIMTVTNNAGKDVEFFPQCEMMTDTFQITQAGIGVPPEVFEKIKERHLGMYPFLEPLVTEGTRILQGQDNTRDFVIIWPDFDAEAKQVSLFITGLSNETVVVENPAEEEGGEPEKVFLRKTLELDYTFAGDAAFRANPNMTFAGASWIMR